MSIDTAEAPTHHHFGCPRCEHAFQVHGPNLWDDEVFCGLYFDAEEANIARSTTNEDGHHSYAYGGSMDRCEDPTKCTRGVDVLGELLAAEGYEIITASDPKYRAELAQQSR